MKKSTYGRKCPVEAWRAILGGYFQILDLLLVRSEGYDKDVSGADRRARNADVLEPGPCASVTVAREIARPADAFQFMGAPGSLITAVRRAVDIVSENWYT